MWCVVNSTLESFVLKTLLSGFAARPGGLLALPPRGLVRAPIVHAISDNEKKNGSSPDGPSNLVEIEACLVVRAPRACPPFFWWPESDKAQGRIIVYPKLGGGCHRAGGGVSRAAEFHGRRTHEAGCEPQPALISLQCRAVVFFNFG